MKKVLIVFGLPGSGKTTYLKKNIIKNKRTLILDDITVLAKNMSLSDFLNNKSLSNYDNLIFSDPMLCLKENQETLVNYLKRNIPNLDISFIFLNCEVDVCVKRGTHNAKATIMLLKDRINVPKGAKIIDTKGGEKMEKDKLVKKSFKEVILDSNIMEEISVKDLKELLEKYEDQDTVSLDIEYDYDLATQKISISGVREVLKKQKSKPKK